MASAGRGEDRRGTACPSKLFSEHSVVLRKGHDSDFYAMMSEERNTGMTKERAPTTRTRLTTGEKVRRRKERRVSVVRREHGRRDSVGRSSQRSTRSHADDGERHAVTPVTFRWPPARLSRCVSSGSTLEGVALHLPPGAMAQPVINEGEVGRGRRRVLGGGAGGLRGRKHHWRLDISPCWFAGGAEASLPGEGHSKRKSVGKLHALSGEVE